MLIINKYYYFIVLFPTAHEQTVDFSIDIRYKKWFKFHTDQKVLFTKILSDFHRELSHINLYLRGKNKVIF